MITKKSVSFYGAMSYSVCKAVLDLENKDLHFYVADGEAMKEVDYQEFIWTLESQAYMCILKDDLRQQYVDFNDKVNSFIDEYCKIVGC
jgi:hypothetical protein